MTSHFYNKAKKKCPLWCDTRCWSFKHSRKMLFSSSIVSHQKNNICFVREKKMADCPTRRRNARGSLLIVCVLPGTTTDGLGLPFPYQSFVCYLPIVSFFLCALGYFIYFGIFGIFTGECCCPATNSYRYDDLIQPVVGGTHTIFWSRLSLVCDSQWRKVLVFQWWTRRTSWVCVCVCVLLFYPFKRRRCDVQCLVMLTDTAFLDDAQ